MALATAARRSLASGGLSDLLARRLHPSLPQLLPSNSTGDPRKPSPLPPPPAPRPFHFALASCGGTSQTLSFLPFGLHLLPGPSRRSFSSSRDTDILAVADAAHSAASAAAPASFPGEVAWAAEDSSMSVAAVQHLIDGVHSFTGLNWWISIALSTVLLRCVIFAFSTFARKRIIGSRQDLVQFIKLVKNAKGKKSLEELADAADPILRKLGFVPFLPCIATPYTFITLYSAISNMVEKVPSLKGGGALWFTDLTTPDALCIFPMITSLFILLRCEVYSSATKRTESSGKMDYNKRQVVRAICLLPMLWTATLPQAISCSFVTWSCLSLVERIAIAQPAVQKVLYGAPLLKQSCSSSDGQKEPTAEESPPPVKEEEELASPQSKKSSDASLEEEEPVSPETKKPSDASVQRDESDRKSSKGG